MVKRTPPLAVAVIGTGTGSQKAVEALLNDFTAPYGEVTFILPVTDDHWSDSTGVVADWVSENEIPYVAVTTGEAPSKGLVPYLEAADNTQKVARISTKVVQLLQSEAADGSDVALFVLWDEDDSEAVIAVNKALAAEVPAYNLLDGLDEFSFDDDDEDGEEQPLPDDQAAAAAEEPEEGDDEQDEEPAAKAQVGDDYDDWGVRKLRAALRDHPNKKHTDRQIGQLDKDDAIRALRVADAAALSGDEPDQDEEESDEAQQAPKAERTTRARRAFAEGVAEATGQDADDVELPRAKGGVLLEEQGYDDEETSDSPPRTGGMVEEDTAKAEGMVDPNAGSYEDTGLRLEALRLAVQAGGTGAEAIPLAQRFELYLKGERKSPGRPRADGSPAQPREIDPETGKPVRRRGSRSTE